MTNQKNLHMITIESDSQLVVNAIKGKSYSLKDIINLVEDIRRFSQNKDICLNYCMTM